MATYNKFDIFITDIHNGVHDLSADQISVAFSLASPDNSLDAVLADVTVTDATNTDSMDVALISSAEDTPGVYALKLTDKVITATAGGVGDFQYVLLYNNGTVNKVDPLIAWFDYGSVISLLDTETFTLDFDVAGLFTNT